MSMSVAEVLDRAADLIEPEGAWVQGWSGKTAKGGFVGALSPLAVCWCAGGAMVRANGGDDDNAADAFDTLRGVINDKVTIWNDALGRTQAEVVGKLREAATLARVAG